MSVKVSYCPQNFYTSPKQISGYASAAGCSFTKASVNLALPRATLVKRNRSFFSYPCVCVLTTVTVCLYVWYRFSTSFILAHATLQSVLAQLEVAASCNGRYSLADASQWIMMTSSFNIAVHLSMTPWPTTVAWQWSFKYKFMVYCVKHKAVHIQGGPN